LELSRPRRSHHWQNGTESRASRDGRINEKSTFAGCPPARMVTESHRNYRHYPKVLNVNCIFVLISFND
jgi:hypothetical protein